MAPNCILIFFADINTHGVYNMEVVYVSNLHLCERNWSEVQYVIKTITESTKPDSAILFIHGVFSHKYSSAIDSHLFGELCRMCTKAFMRVVFVAGPDDIVDSADKIKMAPQSQKLEYLQNNSNISVCGHTFTCSNHAVVMQWNSGNVMELKSQYNSIRKFKYDQAPTGFVIYHRTGKRDVAIRPHSGVLNLKADNDRCYMPDVDYQITAIHLEYSNCTSVPAILKGIEDKYGISPNVAVNADGDNIGSTSEKLNYDELISTMISESQLADSIKPKVLALHRHYMENVINTPRNKWEINYLSWSNVMCYGADNFINFRDIKQMASVVGDNKTGKSCILDMLALILFDKYTRGKTLKKSPYIGQHSPNAHIMCSFSVGSDIYEISLSLTKTHNRTIFKNSADVTPETGAEQISYIESLIGPPKDFINTVAAFQDRTSLTSISNEEKGLFLYHFLGANLMESAEEDVRQKIKEYKKNVKGDIPTDEAIANMAAEMRSNSVKLKSLSQEIKMWEDNISGLHEKKTKLAFECNLSLNYSKCLEAVKALELQLSSASAPAASASTLSGLKTQIRELESIVRPKSEFKTTLGDGVFTADISPHEHYGNDFKSQLSDLAGCLVPHVTPDALDKEKMLLQRARDMYNVITYCDSCDNCGKNKNYIEKIAGMDIMTERISKFELQLARNAEILAKIKGVRALEQSVRNRQTEISAILHDRKEHENRENLKQLAEFHDELHSLELQLQLQQAKKNLAESSKTSQLQTQLSALSEEIRLASKKMQQAKISQIQCGATCERISFEYKKARELNEIYRESFDQLTVYEEYLKYINKKTGAPHQAMLNACNVVNASCNAMLRQITDFQIEFSYDKVVHIDIIFLKNRLAASMCSGFQKFIIDLVLRLSLAPIGAVSRPDFIFIDEGFGCLDQDNLNEVLGCLHRLQFCEQFRMKIILISHITELQTVGDIIRVKTNAGLSQVRYGAPLLGIASAASTASAAPASASDASAPAASASDVKLSEVCTKRGDTFECTACKRTYKYSKASYEKHIKTKTHTAKLQRLKKK